MVGLSQDRVSEIIGNTRFGEIDNLASRGRDMDYIARHYHIDLPPAWAIRLEGKTDQERFEEPGWGIRTWDQWSFKEWATRFGDDWSARHRKLRRGLRLVEPTPRRAGGHPVSVAWAWLIITLFNPKCQVHSEVAVQHLRSWLPNLVRHLHR